MTEKVMWDIFETDFVKVASHDFSLADERSSNINKQ